MRENAKIAVKVEQMLGYAFDIAEEKDKRETAMNNMLVLARENAGTYILKLLHKTW
jgi:Flp pilus assembly protein TadD